MIIVNSKIEGGFHYPARELTENELHSVTSRLFNGIEYIYYQGDEPATVVNINDIKKQVKEAIDFKTQSLILQGFEFKGKIMSMSQNAQINWTNMPNLEESDFPMIIMSKNDEPVQLDYSDKMLIWRAARNHSKNAQLGGGVLKMQIEAMADINDVLNFNDPR